MMSETKQAEVLERIRAEADPEKTWRENYKLMFPDQVTPEAFLDCWRAVDAEREASE